jgi:hypothetical protein
MGCRAVRHAGRVLVRTAVPALVLLVTPLSGCFGDDGGCSGTSYEVDRSERGAASTIDALDAWLADPQGFDELPPRDDWIVQRGGEADAEEVVILNEATGDGWWVHLVRTDDGGYLVDQATDAWRSCQDEL